jgi:hypothetical protein
MSCVEPPSSHRRIQQISCAPKKCSSAHSQSGLFDHYLIALPHALKPDGASYPLARPILWV